MKKHIELFAALATAFVMVACCNNGSEATVEREEMPAGWAENEGYALVWYDQFDAGVLDSTIWNLEDNARGGGNYEMQYYAPKNISFEEDSTGVKCLVLNAIKENYKNRPATSARLNTNNKLAVQYGVIEARIKVPHTADGLWPAFWMLGANNAPNMGNDDSFEAAVRADSASGFVVWPKCGEIDILEMGHADGIANGIQDRYFNGACHWGEEVNNGAYPNHVMNYTADETLQDDFHLYSLVWTPDSILMFLDKDKNPDAKPYYSLATTYKGILDDPGNYFNHPFHLVMNLAVGGMFTGLPGSDTEKYPEEISEDWKNFRHIIESGALAEDGTPSKMYVDFVRIYQRADDGSQLLIKESK